MTAPTGISVADNDVWIVDRSTRRAYVYRGAASLLSGSANASSNFALNKQNTNAQDLVTDGTTVWVADSASKDKVYVYQAGNGSLLGSWTIDSANSSPTGITLDPTGASSSLWICDVGKDRVYEYANGRARRSGSQTASASFALAGGNGNAQGIADPDAAFRAAEPDTLSVIASDIAQSWGPALPVTDAAAFNRPAPASLQPAASIGPARWGDSTPVWTLGVSPTQPAESQPLPSRPAATRSVDRVFAEIDPLLDPLLQVEVAIP